MVDEKAKKDAEETIEKENSADDAKGKEEINTEVKSAEDSKKVEPKEEPDKSIQEEEKKQDESETGQELKEEESKPEKEEVKEPEKAKDEESPAYLNDLNFYPQARKDLPEVKIGDLIDVSYLVVEGGKERLQEFKGTVIAKKGVGISRTMTVRKTSYGIGVERIFPLNSKFVQKVKIRRHSKVRRAKLYYLRKLKGKASRLKELR